MFWTKKAEPVDLKSQVEILAKMATQYQLDSIEALGIKVTKTKHFIVDNKTSLETPKTEHMIDPDQILSWSVENAGRY